MIRFDPNGIVSDRRTRPPAIILVRKAAIRLKPRFWARYGHGCAETNELRPPRAAWPYGSCGLACADRFEAVSGQSQAASRRPDCCPDEKHPAFLDQPNLNR